jgi:putative transposase
MTNHIHLLASPESEASLPKMMQCLGGHYARYFNKCYRRSGSPWEGRYKTSLIDSDEYLLKCYRYIELNPVRAGMVETPQQYRWSSYSENAGVDGVRLKSDTGGENTGDRIERVRLKSDTRQNLLTPHSVYLALSKEQDKRYACYQSLFDETLDRQTIVKISRVIEKGKAVGNPEFLLKVARMRS